MKPPDRPFLIAITGAIASGKSLASNWFRSQGYQVVSTDKIAHTILDDPDISRKIRDHFGDGVCLEGRIDRKLLGKVIFSEKRHQQWLNRLIHPQVFKEMDSIIREAEADYLIFEVPLLFESGLERCFDLIMNIDAEEEILINRITARDRISESEARLKLASQLAPVQKARLADVNINNNGSVEMLEVQLKELFKNLPYYDFRRVIKPGDLIQA
ncbi:MAG: dephospho-CoA kinase [Candidatus Cloacimonetes bacterium]|nr:dephospho-CoA kinase [Candidatus Cloacimonadota bacterium]